MSSLNMARLAIGLVVLGSHPMQVMLGSVHEPSARETKLKTKQKSLAMTHVACELAVGTHKHSATRHIININNISITVTIIIISVQFEGALH